MAKSTKKKSESTKSATSKKTSGESNSPKKKDSEARTGPLWKEAGELEFELEERLLKDAILSAKLALKELDDETRKAPFERRSGLRLREKAMQSERAFNRLRALRKGDMLPERYGDDE
jgi:hypothetical protein